VSADFDVASRDCYETLALAEERGGVDLLITSPPYPDARTVEQYGGAAFDTTLKGYGRLGDAVARALRPGGVAALNIDGPVRIWRPELGESERSLIAFEVAIDWSRRVGLRYVERVSYAREGVPGQRGPRWKCGHELVHVFARTGAPVHFDAYGYTLPAKRPGKTDGSWSMRKGGRRNRTGYIQGDRKQLSTSIDAHVDSNRHTGHPAPFAAELADSFVLCYSPPGGLVCDPFVGSGTVAFSCHRHGRRFIGGDLGVRERDGRSWADVVNDGLAQQRLFPMESQP